MNRVYSWISESYIVVMIVAVLFGLFIPKTHYLIPWNMFFLQVIFFLSCLKINPHQITKFLSDWKFILLANALMMIGFPVLVWALIDPFFPNIGLALFLLAAMPVGMTAPLLVDVVGGKQVIAMVLTTTSSLLAPFTIPLLTKLLYGASVTVDALEMFLRLLSVIFIPFIMAMVARKIFPNLTESMKSKTKPISILLLGLLISGAIAKQSHQVLELSSNLWQLVLLIVSLYAFFFVLHVIGYFAFWWKSHSVKNTVSVALTYMNFTLAIFLASQFFPEPKILLPLVLSIIPWATLLPGWKRASKRLR